MESIEETARAHIAKGMRYKEVKDIDDIATVFNIMAITTESLIEELTKQAEDYKAITASFNNNHAAHGEILGALTEEQMKLQQLTLVIEKMSSATTHTAKEMLNIFQSNLQSKIDQAFNRVDDTALHRSLQQTIEKSLKSINTDAIDNAAKAMNTGAAKIDKLDQVTTRTLNQIAESVKTFNDTVIKSFNKKTIIATGLIALLFGVTIGYAAKTQYIANDFLFWTVDENHRHFDEVKGRYIRFTQEEAESRGDGFYYVKINHLID